MFNHGVRVTISNKNLQEHEFKKKCMNVSYEILTSSSVLARDVSNLSQTYFSVYRALC